MLSTFAVVAAVLPAAVLVRALLGSSRARGALGVLALFVVVVVASPDAPDQVRSTAYLAAAVMLGVACTVRGERNAPAWTARMVLCVALFVLNVVVTAVANAPAIAAVAWVAGLGVLAPVAAARFSEGDRRVFFGGVVVLATAESVLAIAEVVSGRPVQWFSGVAGIGSELPNPLLGGTVDRVVGTLGHPIPLATLLAVATVIVLAAPAVRRSLRWPIIALFVTCIILTGSRSALIAVLLAAVLLLLTSSRRGRSLRVVVGMSFGVAALALSWNDLVTAAAQLIDSGSYTNRRSAIDSVPALLGRPFAEVTFGNGFGSELALRDRGLLPQTDFIIVDNQLVTTLATQGVLGLVLLLVLLVAWFRDGDRLQRALAAAMVVFYFTFDDLRSPAVIVMLLPLLTMPGATIRPSTRAAPVGPDTAVSGMAEPTTSTFVPALRPRTTVHTGSHR